MGFKNYDLPTPEHSSQNNFETVKRHPFNYGLKVAIERGDSKIIESDGFFELRYTPCDIYENVWYGDCAADVLLSGKALGRGTRTIEAQSYDFPDAVFKGTHYKLIFEDTVDGKKVYYPVDHSRFYSSLNPMNATEAVDTGFDGFETEELIGDMKLDSFRNYEEFDINGRPALTMVGMHKRNSDFVISVCVYEQDGKGNVVRRYESSYTFPNDFDEELNPDELEKQLKFGRVHITEKGKGEFKQFQDGVVRDKTIETFASVISAYSRGKRQS